MLRQSSVFALALLSGAASAQSLSGVVNGLLGVGGPATAGALAPVTGPLTGALTSLDAIAQPVLSSAPLPGLAPAKGILPLGMVPVDVTVLDDGQNPNSGYDDVVELSGMDVITSGNEPGDTGGPTESGPIELNSSPLLSGVPLVETLTGALDGGLRTLGLGGLPGTQPEPLGTPYLLSSDGNDENIDVGVFDGDGTANADPAMGIGAAIGSGSNTGTGTIGLGIGNDTNTGNGSLIGIAALSDNRDGSSGNGGTLGVSLLNQGDTLTINGMGVDQARDMAGNQLTSEGNAALGALTPVASLSILGGDNTGNGGGLLSAAVLSGDNSGNNGTVALGVLSGNGTAQGDLAGVGILTGDNSATGPIAAGVLTGDNSVVTNEGAAGTGILAAGVLTGDDSVRGTNTNSTTTNVDAPFLGATVLGGKNSGADGRSTNANVLTGGGAPAPLPPASVTPGANPDDNGEDAQKVADSALCKLLAKDNRGRVTNKLREKAVCNKTQTPKA